MSKLNVQQIRDKAHSIVIASPGGIRFSEIVRRISEESPETPLGTIQQQVIRMPVFYPDISKPGRGLFVPANSKDEGEAIESVAEQIANGGIKVHEADFYEPFAEWLRDDLEEVTVVASLGGAGLKSKWGTPDVVGVYKPKAAQLIKFPLEIVSAEIKIDPQAPVVAFGQAMAYRLFSSKTYVVMPTSLTEEDKSRLDSLSMLFGIGFVLFNVDRDDPDFSIRVRAQRFAPDMFYVNDFAERLRAHNGPVFELLFS
jgi:hypothetical protein